MAIAPKMLESATATRTSLVISARSVPPTVGALTAGWAARNAIATQSVRWMDRHSVTWCVNFLLLLYRVFCYEN